MDVVYMGTPEFAVPTLRRLHASGHRVRAVVTGIDRPRGRGHALRPTPVALAAEALGLPVIKPERIDDRSFLDRFKQFEPDAVALVAYGKLIPKEILELPRHGCVNLHPSLLPRYRGAAPIHAPLLNGDGVTGVTTMFMDEGLDTGDIILQEEVEIEPYDNAGDLHDRLAVRGADLMLRTFDLLGRGSVPRIAQDDERASYAAKVEKERIRWDRPSTEVAARIRGLSPYPGAYTFMGGTRLKVLRAVVGPRDVDVAPGEVASVSERGVVVGCSGGSVVLLEVQPEGKSPMAVSEFAKGYAGAVIGGLT